tara:strand:+ start:210 stop:437 length:228 start_codon:yes stop_codon:yes gene_type:complete
MAQRNKVTVTDSGVVKIVSVGTQGPSGSATFLIQGKSISQSPAPSGNEITQYKSNTDQWEATASPVGLTIDAGVY